MPTPSDYQMSGLEAILKTLDRIENNRQMTCEWHQPGSVHVVVWVIEKLHETDDFDAVVSGIP